MELILIFLKVINVWWMLLHSTTYYVHNFSDRYIQKAKKVFTDSRARRNLSALNTELQDVQRIMVQNIDDVLQRGVVLSGKVNHCWFLFTFKWQYCFPNEWSRILCIWIFLFFPSYQKENWLSFLGMSSPCSTTWNCVTIRCGEMW